MLKDRSRMTLRFLAIVLYNIFHYILRHLSSYFMLSPVVYTVFATAFYSICRCILGYLTIIFYVCLALYITVFAVVEPNFDFSDRALRDPRSSI